MTVRWHVVAVVAAVVLAGCASDQDGTASPATAASSTAAPTAAASTTPVASAPPAATTSAAAGTEASVTTEATAPPRATVRRVAELDGPTDLASRAGDSTLFVTQQIGLVTALRSGASPVVVLDMRDLTAPGGERGLLGIAFHPSRPLAYLDYTDTDGNTKIDEYTVGADGTFDPSSRREVLSIDQPYANHNGGALEFGPDGYLYIGMGDGGAGGDPERRAMNLTTLLGKILRIDPTESSGDPYSVPADNPFVGRGDAHPEIWAYGLRNPWRIDFDRRTGDLWIADVGQDAWEEIDVASAADGGGKGVNFGWSAFEGTHRYNDDVSPDGVTMPVFEYAHDGGACSISGGVLYRGTKIPALDGWYVYADFCTGSVHAVRPDGAGDHELTRIDQVSAVEDGPDGEAYVLSLDQGVFALVPA